VPPLVSASARPRSLWARSQLQSMAHGETAPLPDPDIVAEALALLRPLPRLPAEAARVPGLRRCPRRRSHRPPTAARQGRRRAKRCAVSTEHLRIALPLEDIYSDARHAPRRQAPARLDRHGRDMWVDFRQDQPVRRGQANVEAAARTVIRRIRDGPEGDFWVLGVSSRIRRRTDGDCLLADDAQSSHATTA